MEATPFLQRIGVRRTDEPNVFQGVSLPLGMGNLRPIAYGGFAIATAIVAAGQTIPTHTRFVPYSVLGNFLGPASLKEPFVCHVSNIRDTRSFATRFVLVKQRAQTKEGGSEMRTVLSLTLDMVASPNTTSQKLAEFDNKKEDPACANSLLRYDPVTEWHIPAPDAQTPSMDEYYAMRIREGTADEQVIDMTKKFLGLWYEIFSAVPVPSSMPLQNFTGMLDIETTQDKLPYLDRRSFDWLSMRDKIPSALGTDPVRPTRDVPDMLPIQPVIAHAASMAFALDGAMPFIPLGLAKKNLIEASAASTLEFATRFNSDILDMNQYHLREIKPIHAGWGRTYNEARLFDTRGRLVATCTQQGVLKPADPSSVATPEVPPPYRLTSKL